MTDMASLQAIVHGRVQGVFFRAYVEELAERLNLKGYVCNRTGGAVEVIAEGEKPKLEKLVEYLKIGPPAARVMEVIATWREYSGGFLSFRVRY